MRLVYHNMSMMMMMNSGWLVVDMYGTVVVPGEVGGQVGLHSVPVDQARRQRSPEALRLVEQGVDLVAEPPKLGAHVVRATGRAGAGPTRKKRAESALQGSASPHAQARSGPVLG